MHGPVEDREPARLVTRYAAACLIVATGLGCAMPDYGPLEEWYAGAPRTILVLPVRNETTDAEAQTAFLATLTEPLLARGYYVLPTGVAHEILAREGIYDAGLAWEVQPHLYQRYLGADGLLYVTIEHWDTQYFLISSSVVVTVLYRLVDARSGEVLWERRVEQKQSSGGFFIDPIGAAVAVTGAALNAATTHYTSLARQANVRALAELNPGPYNPAYAEIQEQIRAWRAEKDRQAAEAEQAAHQD